jgi:hypothetical protein
MPGRGAPESPANAGRITIAPDVDALASLLGSGV